VVNYGWPAWLAEYSWTAGYIVRRESMTQATVTTAHVATGSLILAVAVVLALRAWKVKAFGPSDGTRHQASASKASDAAMRRSLGEANFAFCILRFAFCISRDARLDECKMQNAKRKMKNGYRRIGHSAVEQIA
jgi:hypothetical protein